MRVLWLTPEVPEPAGTGGGQRSHHLLLGLAAQGLGVTVVAPAYPRQRSATAELERAGVELRLATRPPSRAAEAARALRRQPELALSAARSPWLGLQAAVFWTALGPLARAALATRPADVAVVEHDFCAVWAGALPIALPAVLHAHNAWWRHLERQAMASGMASGLVLRAEAARYRAHVRGALRRYGRICAVSGPDAQAFTSLGARAVDVIPNGVDAGRLGGVAAGEGERGEMIFTGNLGYAPNAEAVAWMAQEVLPLVRAARPDARLTVVGRGASPGLRRLAAREGVELTGWVEDLAPRFAAASVAVAPMRSGGGTNLKVFDALAAGRALVATPLAAEGTGLVAGEHALVAADPASFASAVVELLGDEARRRELGAAGRALALASHDWSALAHRLASVLAAEAGA